MIVDTFLFFNELDLLEIRLNSLAPYVDRFVLCESSETHSGNPKPLWFAENKERFKDFPITHVIHDPIDKPKPIPGQVDGNAWKREHRQRDSIKRGLEGIPDDAMILLSDLDEIPDLEHYDGKSEGSFKVWMYYYYFNVFTGMKNWKCTVAMKKSNVDKTDMNDIRNRRNQFNTILYPGGWHFSTLGTAEEIQYKIKSFAHMELNKPEFLDNIADRRAKLEDPYHRGASNWRQEPQKMTVEMPSGPKWLLENKHRYPHLFYEPGKSA